MSSEFTSANTSFDFLSRSSDFLNLILNNINSCIMLLNKDLELQAFNNAFKTIFSNKADEHLLYVKCGEALGCAYQVEEMKECGTTSKCRSCEIRISAMMSYQEKKAIYKNKISREFFRSDSKKELKHLQFSTRPFYFEKEYYIILIIEDITKMIFLEEKIKLSSSN
ncbi:hypothetical protein ACFLTE_05465 [Bacteroidota bacterium]